MTQPDAGRPNDTFDWQRKEERWYARQRSKLLSLCFAIVRDRQVAEDVVHETFARALAGGLYPDRRSGPWLRAVAHNLCIDHVRRSVRLTQLPETEDLKAAEALERVGDAVDHSATYAAVGAAFTALPARDRRVLWLRDVEGWDYPDIASADGSTTRAVRSRAHRARVLMRSRLVATLARNLGIAVAMLRLRLRRSGQRTSWEGAYGLVAVSIATSLSIAGLTLFFKPSGPAPPAEVSAASAAPRAGGTSRPFGTGATDAARTAQGTAARDPSAGDPPRPMGIPETVDEIVNPTADATPENTYFEAIEPSPAFDRDRTIFAGGSHLCRVQWTTGCPVLFVTNDGGRQWRRLAAEGLAGWVHDLALPPAYPNDPRIFVRDDTGIKESTDGGDSFRLVSPLAQIGGKLAISPQFNNGDPRILAGGAGSFQVWEYRADLGLTKTALLPILSGDPSHLRPTFSPNYAADGLIIVGGMQVLDPTVRYASKDAGGTMFVYRCTPVRCDTITLNGSAFYPWTALSPTFGKDGLGFVVTGPTIFRSRDGARTFVDIGLPPGESWVNDVTFRSSSSPDRSFVVASFTGWRTKGLYKSIDGAGTWIPIPVGGVAGFDGGFRIVEVAGSNGPIIAADWGIVCSSDEGRTWARRC